MKTRPRCVFFSFGFFALGVTLGCGGSSDGTPDMIGSTIDTQITAQPAANVNTPEATFEFSSSTGASVFVCHTDADAFAPCNSPVKVTVIEGAHAFEVAAVANGIQDPTPAQATWSLDLTLPTTTSVTGPAEGSTSGPKVTFTYASNEGGATFECQLDVGSFAKCPTPNDLVGLSEGAHTLGVRAIDFAGNSAATAATRNWTVDATPPDTAIDLPTPPARTVGRAMFFVSSPEAGATFECAIDTGAYAACTSPVTMTGIADGAHTFHVRAVDAYGNADATPADFA